MKRNFYQIHEQISDNCYLHYNTLNDQFIFLDKYAHLIYINAIDLNDICIKDKKLFDNLVHFGFIIPDDYDEKAIVELRRRKEQHDMSLYHIVINPTLDCNLSCWYCYENKIKKSHISQNVIEGIKKNIETHYKFNAYNTLKISFFGGEPLLYFTAIEDICNFANDFCKKNKITLLLDFTTNGTLIKNRYLNFLSEYNCTFQITLDGNRNQHNKIKHFENKDIDTYKLTIDNILNTQKTISNSLIYLRINFDEKTLKNFDDILNDINLLDRKRTAIILKKIWQVNSNKINKKDITSAIQKLFNLGFIVDYYTQGKLCFGERLNEVVINYDGNVFKCTTINSFDKKHSFGKLDTNTGFIVWDENKLSHLTLDLCQKRCRECKLYPTCYGPCNFHLIKGHYGCYLDSINLSMSEYLMFLVKLKRQEIMVFNKDANKTKP